MKIIEFQNRVISELESNPSKDVFEFTRDKPEYHFLNIFMQKTPGIQDKVIENIYSSGSITYKWRNLDKSIEINKYRLMNTYYIYVDRKNLIKIINKLIDNYNQFLIDRYGKYAKLVDSYKDIYFKLAKNLKLSK